jgi:hypothetical protein
VSRLTRYDYILKKKGLDLGSPSERGVMILQAEDLFQAKQPAAALKTGKVQKKRKMNVIDVQRATAVGVQAKGLK